MVETRHAKRVKRGMTAFDQFRQSGACSVMYSFLTVKERVKLGQVDKTFYQDAPNRGTTEGIYGAKGISTREAFLYVKKYVEYLTTPECLHWAGLEHVSEPWHWIFDEREPENIIPKIKTEWFDPNETVPGPNGVIIKGIWKMEKIAKELDEDPEFPHEWKDTILEGMNFVDYQRRSDLIALGLIDKKLNAMADPIPYGKLFSWMKEFNLGYRKMFLTAEEPHFYGHSDNAYPIYFGPGSYSYLDHLKPGAKFVFRNDDNEWVGMKVFRCKKCNKQKDGVKQAYCASKYCFGSAMFCQECTPIKTCSTCHATGCGCFMMKCSQGDCNNHMCCCDDFGAYKYDDRGPAKGCSFVKDSYDEESDERPEHYCSEHAPPGSVAYHGYCF